MSSELKSIPRSEIVITKDNPRVIREDDPKIIELAASIKARGVLEPVLLRPHENKKAKYELRAGARRFVAAGLAGLAEIPAIVREMTDEEAFEITIIENLQRDNLSPLEEARSIKSMLDKGWTIQIAASHIGKSPAWVVRRSWLTALSEKWQKEIDDPKGLAFGAPAGHLELIARLPVESQDDFLLKLRGGYRVGLGGRSMKELENDLGGYVRFLRTAKWSLSDEDLVPGSGACLLCPKRSAHQPGLFDDFDAGEEAIKKSDRCLDPGCWEKKLEAFTKKKHEELKKEHPAVLLGTEYNPRGHDEPFVKGETVQSWQYEKAKKTDPKAVPLLTVNGDNAGRVEWVKPKKEYGVERQVERQKKAARTVPGSPEERKRIARGFADAWSCVIFANQAYGAHDAPSPFPAFLTEMRRKAEAAALVAIAERRGDYSAQRVWLKEHLEIAGKGPEAILERFESEDMRVFIVAVGLFDYLDYLARPDRKYNPDAITRKAKIERFEFPVSTLEHAARSFVPPASYFEEHRKDDLLIIGRQMGLPVKATMRATDLKDMLSKASEAFEKVRAGEIDAMPEKWAGYSPLGEDMAQAFGQEWTAPTPAAAKEPPAKKRGKPAKEQKCRLCGCTESTPCINDETDEPCHWVKPNLCSECVDKVKKNAPQKADKKKGK